MAEQRKVPKLAGVIVEHQDHLGALTDDDAQWAIQNTVAAIGLFVTAVTNRGTKIVQTLFTSAGMFSVPGTKKFVAKEHYVIDTTETARVRISYLGDNFKKYLRSKVERDISPFDLKMQVLRRPQTDLPKNVEEPGTIFGLGGLDKADIGLYAFFETLAHKQAIGDFTWTVGFAYDDNGVLWAVRADWCGDGWGVEASSPGNRGGGGVGGEFLSR